MTDREKLIELIAEAGTTVIVNGVNYGQVLPLTAEPIANHLIANGVTVQKWIPATERLPSEHDADADLCVLAIHKACNKRYWHWRSVKDNPFDFTHWMPLPEPPKE